MLDPRERTFWTTTPNHPPATVPPSVRYGSPSDNRLPQNEFTEAEDLGINDMQALPVHGVREVETRETTGIGFISRWGAKAVKLSKTCV